MENQPIVRLAFTCDRNWKDMVPVKDGRFCNDCQKKVVDFTDKTNDEIAAYLINSTKKVCGRFQQSQLASLSPKPIWKRWLSAVAMFAAVFMGIKEASAQIKTKKDTTNQVDSLDLSKGYPLGEIYIPPTSQTIFTAKEVDVLPSFPGGYKAYRSYLHKKFHVENREKGRVFASFVVERDGSLTDIKVILGLEKEMQEAMKVLKQSPKWKPGFKNGIKVRTAYTIAISVDNTNNQ